LHCIFLLGRSGECRRKIRKTFFSSKIREMRVSGREKKKRKLVLKYRLIPNKQRKKAIETQ